MPLGLGAGAGGGVGRGLGAFGLAGRDVSEAVVMRQHQQPTA